MCVCVIEMLIESLDGPSSYLFSNELFEKRPVMTIEDFDFCFDGYFEFYLFRFGLYQVLPNEK